MRKTIYILCLIWISAYFEVCAQASWLEIVSKGLRFQMQADSLQRLSDTQTAALATAPESEKGRIRIAIRDYNAKAEALQKQANEQFAQAARLEPVSTKAETTEVAMDYSAVVEGATMKEIEPDNNKEAEFAILSKSPYSTANPIPIDNPLPDGVAYKIQLGAFSRVLPANTYRGLTPLSGERMENGVTKYYVGLFRLYSDADDALRKVREYGFRDAYIVAFYNRKPINSERAKQLETADNLQTINH